MGSRVAEKLLKVLKEMSRSLTLPSMVGPEPVFVEIIAADRAVGDVAVQAHGLHEVGVGAVPLLEYRGIKELAQAVGVVGFVAATGEGTQAVVLPRAKYVGAVIINVVLVVGDHEVVGRAHVEHPPRSRDLAA